MTYIICKIKDESKEHLYRVYVTNCLQAIANNTAKIGGGSVIKKSYMDIIEKIENASIYSGNVQPTKTADQIVATTVAKLGLRLIDNTRKEEN